MRGVYCPRVLLNVVIKRPPWTNKKLPPVYCLSAHIWFPDRTVGFSSVGMSVLIQVSFLGSCQNCEFYLFRQALFSSQA